MVPNKPGLFDPSINILITVLPIILFNCLLLNSGLLHSFCFILSVFDSLSFPAVHLSNQRAIKRGFVHLTDGEAGG